MVRALSYLCEKRAGGQRPGRRPVGSSSKGCGVGRSGPGAEDGITSQEIARLTVENDFALGKDHQSSGDRGHHVRVIASDDDHGSFTGYLAEQFGDENSAMGVEGGKRLVK